MEVDTLSDPARFAQAIRGLAHDAHRTLKHSPSPAALRRLSRRIELLASALGDRRERPARDLAGQPRPRGAVCRRPPGRVMPPMCACA